MSRPDVIKALRGYGSGDLLFHHYELQPIAREAADHIEALIKQVDNYKAEYVVLMSEMLDYKRRHDAWKARAEAAEQDVSRECETCKFSSDPANYPPCETCGGYHEEYTGTSGWQWRGPCAENAKEDGDGRSD